jgi:hypothetical protein
MTKQQYITRHLRRTARFERAYTPAMQAAIGGYIRAFIKTMKASGVQAALTARNSNDRIVTVIKNLYENVGMFYARLTTREIAGSIEKKAFGVNEEMDARILESLTKSLFRDVNSITESIKSQLLTIIKEGLANGWGIDKMAFAIEEAGLPLIRARLIIRTELVKAMNVGKVASKDESEFETQDTWIATHDPRTRHSHTLIDEYKINEGEKFPVRKRKGGFDMMTGPGDPTAGAENVCNCRCTSVTRAKRDQNGRLVRKRKIFVALPGEMRRAATVTI